MRAEVLRNPCILGGPHQRGQEWPASSSVVKCPSSVVKCPEGWSIRAALKKKKIWFLWDRPDQKWPKSCTLATKVHILNTKGNFSPTGVGV